MTFFTDTHCHLNLQEFKTDFESVITRASAAGIRKILIPGIDLETSLQAVILSKKHPGFLYAAAGIHPNHSASVDPAEIRELESLAGNKDVVAIGEIGLDFYRDKASAEEQIAIFKKMLSISLETEKPICIHNRNADSKILEILDEWYSKLLKSQSNLIEKPGVFHSFSGSEAILSWALEHHFYLGISGPLTFSKSLDLQKIIMEIDIAHLLLETDSPYLSPYPFRGKRNEPGNVKFVCEKIAELKQITLNDVMTATSNNAKNLFGWADA